MNTILYAFKHFKEWPAWDKVWFTTLMPLFTILNLWYMLALDSALAWLNAFAFLMLITLTPITLWMKGDTMKHRHQHKLDDLFANYMKENN